MGVVLEADAALKNHTFNDGEVLVGLAELIGKIIAKPGRTTIQMDEMQKVVVDHLDRTIKAVGSVLENNELYRG